MLQNLTQAANLQQNWCVLYTYPNYEKKILKAAIKKDIVCFLPTQKVVREWSDRRKILEVPLFPNYLFVQVNKQNRFKILDITGVVRFVSHSGRPAVISNYEIDLIKKMADSEEITLEQDLINGDLVRIIDGPFTGLSGTLFQRKGKDKLAVKIEGLNQSISISISKLTVEKYRSNRS
jgi:transcriptional antiterminator RfaH